MPCSDEGRSAHEAQLAIAEMQSRLDDVTRMLCSTLAIVDGRGMIRSVPKDVQKWWRAHKANDAARVKHEREEREAKQVREAARRRGLAKLTDDEARALGLNPTRRGSK